MALALALAGVALAAGGNIAVALLLYVAAAVVALTDPTFRHLR